MPAAAAAAYGCLRLSKRAVQHFEAAERKALTECLDAEFVRSVRLTHDAYSRFHEPERRILRDQAADAGIQKVRRTRCRRM